MKRKIAQMLDFDKDGEIDSHIFSKTRKTFPAGGAV